MAEHRTRKWVVDVTIPFEVVPSRGPVPSDYPDLDAWKTAYDAWGAERDPNEGRERIKIGQITVPAERFAVHVSGSVLFYNDPPSDASEPHFACAPGTWLLVTDEAHAEIAKLKRLTGMEDA